MNEEARKLEALEERLRKDLEAVARVKSLMAFNNGALSRPDERQLQLPVVVDLQEDNDPDYVEDADEVGSPGATLIDTVSQLINSNPQVKWTTAKVVAQLEKLNFEFRAKKPVYSVGQALNKLAARDEIRITRRGSGSTPNIYRAARNTDKPTVEEDSIAVQSEVGSYSRTE